MGNKLSLYEEVFNKSSIYDMLFFNVKGVLAYPTLNDLKENNLPMYERWKYLNDVKYNGNIVDEKYREEIYKRNAINHPEYTRIVAITYATLFVENGTIKRFFKKILNEDEYIVIATFFDVLNQMASESTKSTPAFFYTLCGHNIISHDIPLLIKRFILNREKFEANKQLPIMLKNALVAKPWEADVVDVVNVWKFNGFDYTPLMLVADFLGLKKTVDLLTNNEISQYYWDNVKEKPEETLEYVAHQSATQTNLVIQLMNELRQL